MWLDGAALVVLLWGVQPYGDVWAPAHADEASSSRYVALVSDCLRLTLRPELIDSLAAVPEPVTLPSGQASYTITVQVGAQRYGLCYPSAEARDQAMTRVQERLVGGP